MDIEDKLIFLFYIIDNFCKGFADIWSRLLVSHPGNQKFKDGTRFPSLSLSEMMTILVFFHHSGYRTFKHYYVIYIQGVLRKFFPRAVSYSRMVRATSQALFPIFCFLQTILGRCSGISFVDSTLLTVCHNRRIQSHKVFKGLAARGKTTTGWFYGFKLHLIINDQGEILAYRLTPGNVDDRVPILGLCEGLFGKLFGDKGYISSKLFNDLFARRIEMITRLKIKMRNKLMSLWDKLLLRRRGLIESVHNRLKNGAQIEHHRHRSCRNFITNLLGGLAAYQVAPNKPTLNLRKGKKEGFTPTLKLV